MARYAPLDKERARRLRREMTDAEQKLWRRLRRKQLQGLQFYRQRPLKGYIVDFYCPAAKLVIEVDGGQHYLPEGTEYDLRRDACLKSLGLTVLRFSNRDVLCRMVEVLTSIEAYIRSVFDNKDKEFEY